MLCFCLGEQVSGVEAPVLECDPVCQQIMMLFLQGFFFFFYPRMKPTRTGDSRGNSCNYLVILDYIFTSEMDTYYYFMALFGP